MTQVPAIFFTIPYFLLLILLNWVGFLFKKKLIKKYPDLITGGLGSAEGSLLGLTALMLSFSFGMSASKFDNRRQIIVEESNDIGTAILRCDLYPDSIRNLFRADLKKYVESRIHYYEVGDDNIQIQQAISTADSISRICWKRAATLGHNLDNRVATAQMIPALNAVIDVVGTRDAGRQAVIPTIILEILCILTLISSFLVGYGSKGHERNQVMVISFALMTTLALYLVIDLDQPRQGFINLNVVEKLMLGLRKNFN